MIRRPPRSTRTDTLFPSRRSSDLVLAAGLDRPFDHLRIGEGEIGGADRLDDRARCKAQPLPLGRIKPFHLVYVCEQIVGHQQIGMADPVELGMASPRIAIEAAILVGGATRSEERRGGERVYVSGTIGGRGIN